MFAPHCFGWLIQVLVERGRIDEARALLAEAGADGAVPETYAATPLLRARAVLRLGEANADASAGDAHAYGRALEAVGMRNPAAGPWRSDAALALLSSGKVEEARPLAATEVEVARRWGAPRAVGRALRVLGLAEGGEAGIATLRESVLALEDSPALLERARSLVELGAALRRSLKKIEARDRLRAGLDLAQRCGAVALAERAREELVAAGARPRSAAVSGAAALTPSERRIAALAAEGMTNRQIAQSLFVTPRTVEMHLSNAFRKLRIGSRTQLAEALAG
jgi:DNA-binding CsgD family transcriptional regulator